MPEFLQTEGVDAVLDNLTKRARVTAVTTSPYVMAPADEKTGSREPPIDAGAGSVRLLDRPILGKRELFIQTAPSFTPDVRLYEGLQYRPAAPTQLTKEHGAVVGQFIQAAHARGLKVYLQIQAAIPPGYRVQFGGASAQDQPLLPDGSVPSKRLANNGTLASTEMLKYTQALIRDLCIAYPQIDGIRLDWPELTDFEVIGSGLDIPTSYDPDGFRARHGIEGPFVMYAGRREGGKNWERMLDAFARAVVKGKGETYRRYLPGELDLVRRLLGNSPEDRRFGEVLESRAHPGLLS